MALWPLHQKYNLDKVIVSTYQAASGAGNPGQQELFDGCQMFLENTAEGQDTGTVQGLPAKVFQHPLCFNVIPHIDKFQDNGYTKEEMKVVWEMRKIFGIPDMKVSCTAVRVPAMRAHAEAITLYSKNKMPVEEVRAILQKADGVEMADDPSKNVYPMPHTASCNWDVQVGRLRQSTAFDDHCVDLFVCCDQLLRGAALNAVIIAEKWFEIRAENGYPAPRNLSNPPNVTIHGVAAKGSGSAE
eukprot:gene272-931_t